MDIRIVGLKGQQMFKTKASLEESRKQERRNSHLLNVNPRHWTQLSIDPCSIDPENKHFILWIRKCWLRKNQEIWEKFKKIYPKAHSKGQKPLSKSDISDSRERTFLTSYFEIRKNELEAFAA